MDTSNILPISECQCVSLYNYKLFSYNQSPIKVKNVINPYHSEHVCTPSQLLLNLLSNQALTAELAAMQGLV